MKNLRTLGQPASAILLRAAVAALRRDGSVEVYLRAGGHQESARIECARIFAYRGESPIFELMNPPIDS
jgi:hypothetical protein